MSHLLGEFDCKLDAKGRVIIPVGLKKQLPGVDVEGLVINRGFEKHLVIYPRKEWDKVIQHIATTTNSYQKKTRELLRYITRGATELTIDTGNRVLLPKPLLEYANIKNDLVLSCQFNQIEVWAAEAYYAEFNKEDDDIADTAEHVMAKLNTNDE
jgi:MraZ protein